MRKIVFLLACLFTVQAFAQAPKKIYVQEDQVAIFDSKIWVNDGEKWIRTQNLSSDEQGLYSFYVEIDPEDFPVGGWVCGGCGRLYPNSVTTCADCDKK